MPARGAISPGNVLVLYNIDSPDGTAVANHYAEVHPGVNLLGLSGVTTAEDVTADYYLNTIRPQILPALNSSITTVVTTKDLPLRICVNETNPGTYVDPFGITRTVGSGLWQPYSSLESELTHIDEISTWQQMGDQTYYNTPSANNPYYLPTFNTKTFQYEARSASFDYNNYYTPGFGGMRLTARLDGFTSSDINSATDRAQKAYLLPGASAQLVVMDDSPNSVGVDRISNLKTVLDNKPQAYVYNTDSSAVTTAVRPVIGYVSHGTNDGPGGLDVGYMDPNVSGYLAFTLANGAVFFTHESYNAYSFKPGGNMAGQGLVAEWLALGGTAGVGNVWEPGSGRTTEANEDQIFKMLLDGYTWGEAAWSSLRQLSYVNTVVGDPLMTWKQVLPGDANLDGKVTAMDLDILSTNWMRSGQAGGAMWGYGDFNGDGTVTALDLDVLSTNWGKTASWASGSAAVAAPLDVQAFLDSIAVPEPTAISLFIAPLISILVGYLYCQSRRAANLIPSKS
jgi:uncharacterized protein (TIGR03790 family)